MGSNKIVRSVCYFTNDLDSNIKDTLKHLQKQLLNHGFVVQTKRICATDVGIKRLDKIIGDPVLNLSVGTLLEKEITEQMQDFYKAANVLFNVDLTDKEIRLEHTDILFSIIKDRPEKTFNFTYVFNNALSSPFMPAASYERNGFSVGLQSTDLSQNCDNLAAWLEKMTVVWDEIVGLFSDREDFLGIDSSVAPLFNGKSSLINFVSRIGGDFAQSVTTSIYTDITKFIKEKNPKPVGLCGLMFPCLEDFELAQEYEKGEFSIERNIYLSLHSGLGIDTYPIGIDEKPERVLEILKLLQNLSNKYKKPLSARFVSDGKAKIGKKTKYQNQYLKDITVRKL